MLITGSANVKSLLGCVGTIYSLVPWGPHSSPSAACWERSVQEPAGSLSHRTDSPWQVRASSAEGAHLRRVILECIVTQGLTLASKGSQRPSEHGGAACFLEPRHAPSRLQKETGALCQGHEKNHEITKLKKEYT